MDYEAIRINPQLDNLSSPTIMNSYFSLADYMGNQTLYSFYYFIVPVHLYTMTEKFGPQAVMRTHLFIRDVTKISGSFVTT